MWYKKVQHPFLNHKEGGELFFHDHQDCFEAVGTENVYIKSGSKYWFASCQCAMSESKEALPGTGRRLH